MFSAAQALLIEERPFMTENFDVDSGCLEMTSFKRDFAQKFSINSQQSGEKTPSEFSVSIAGNFFPHQEISIISVFHNSLFKKTEFK